MTVVKFPESETRQCKTAFDGAMAEPDTRVFAAFTFDKDGHCGVFFPEELMLSELLLARAIMDDAIQMLIRSQVDQ
jgi:hypothetical protein